MKQGSRVKLLPAILNTAVREEIKSLAGEIGTVMSWLAVLKSDKSGATYDVCVTFDNGNSWFWFYDTELEFIKD